MDGPLATTKKTDQMLWVNLGTLYISLPSHYATTKSPRLSQDHLIPQLPTAVHPQMNC